MFSSSRGSWCCSLLFIRLRSCRPVIIAVFAGNGANQRIVIARQIFQRRLVVDLQRLGNHHSGAADYPGGPGDALEISVPGMVELKNMVASLQRRKNFAVVRWCDSGRRIDEERSRAGSQSLAKGLLC